jgi:2-polyprenyl-3-methyl-5-hydroxy-6-metoxy-1,4-benzoquinol methylase
MALPFGWQELADMAPGRLMDVGCGTGATLALGRQLGWAVEGLEMDRDAVLSARAAGLRVGEGGYERLADSPLAFDCIICSHVIEHVFDPVGMLGAMHAALKPGGTLLLSTPNVCSDVHRHFGKYWRGLEAPRHLVLFSEASLTRLLQTQGFEVVSRSDQELATVRDSARIARGGARVNSADRAIARRLSKELFRTPRGQDFIKLVAQKR